MFFFVGDGNPLRIRYLNGHVYKMNVISMMGMVQG